MAESTAADPHRIELCWTPDQNFGRVSVLPSRAPVWSILGLLRAGESPEVVADEFPGVTPDQVRMLGRLAADLAGFAHSEPPATAAEVVPPTCPTHGPGGHVQSQPFGRGAEWYCTQCDDTFVDLIHEVDSLRYQVRGYQIECRDTERALAEALGYPLIPEDELTSPCPGEYAIGDHTACTLATDAADEITQLRDIRAEVDSLRETASFEGLIERSSLGTPAAQRLRARTPPEVAQRIVDRAAEMEHARPRLVVVCGSITDEDRLLTAALWHRQPGTVVHIPRAEAALTKAEHDREHREWIDLADEVVVVRKPDGLIGESTAAEVAYARERGVPVYWWPEGVSE